MEWSADGIVLGARPHGENDAILDLFTSDAGKISGLVHGGQGRRKGPLVQPGNQVAAIWKGRGEGSLGHFQLELLTPRAAGLMGEATGLLTLSSVCALLSACLPEKQSVPRLYDATLVLLDLLDQKELLPVLLAKWEQGLLAELGFGLTLDRCAATGALLEDGADLVYVSPKSACAVTEEAGRPYADRLLPLPPFLIDRGEATIGDVRAALELTGYFLDDRLLRPADKSLPPMRDQLIRRLTRAG